MQMFEYESLYNTKIFGKTFHKKMEILAAICTMFQKLYFLFYPVKIQENKYSSQLFDISLFKDSKHVF